LIGHTLSIRPIKLNPTHVRARGRCSCGKLFWGPGDVGWDEPVEIAFAWDAHLREVERSET